MLTNNIAVIVSKIFILELLKVTRHYAQIFYLQRKSHLYVSIIGAHIYTKSIVFVG